MESGKVQRVTATEAALYLQKQKPSGSVLWTQESPEGSQAAFDYSAARLYTKRNTQTDSSDALSSLLEL